jgi:hypothetical protein
MKKILLILLFLILPTISFAETVASCQNPKGHSYYPFNDMTIKKDAGWFKDGISGGITQLEIDKDGNYDIQFVDASKQIVSAKKDGANIVPLAKGENKFAISTIYSGNSIETYAFFKEKSGELSFTMTQTKINTAIAKAGVMQGTCNFINFDMIK